MKLRGLVGNTEIVVMIDPGATHNFVAINLVKTGEVTITTAGSFGVSLGNGETIRGEGLCRAVCVQLEGGGLEVVEDFLPLELGSADVILGVQWLEKLGVVKNNWKTQLMEFEVDGEAVILKGDPTLIRAKVSLKAMLRMLKKTGTSFWVECNRMEVDKQSPTSSPPEFLQEIISRHQQVFATPTGLPPQRDHEHTIVLKEGCDPVSVRPYRYLQCQKDAIERLIAEILAAGIIKPLLSWRSTSRD